MADLQPPRKSVELQDPGAHELQTHDETSEHGQHSDVANTNKTSEVSIPTTRVERVDDEPSHGEVPGTEAYDMRTADAEPDQFEVIPESPDLLDRSQPTSEVEEAGSDSASSERNGLPTSTELRSESPKVEPPPAHYEAPNEAETLAQHDLGSDVLNGEQHDGEDEAETFGDDFDDFEEGEEADDFGDFDDHAEEPSTKQTHDIAPIPESAVLEHNFIPQRINFDWESFQSAEEAQAALQPILQELFPNSTSDTETMSRYTNENGHSLLTERSHSLWAQLVAPPPIQPPNWVQSRVRRLFLVSLGVPVDLDEILPASKQKKLVLPSLEVDTERSPTRQAEKETTNTGKTRQQENGSSTSVNTTGLRAERRRRGPAPPPSIDLNSARRICNTTDAALNNFTTDELESHMVTLKAYSESAKDLFEYWTLKRDSAQGEKAAFEEVIENLVKHAKRLRK